MKKIFPLIVVVGKRCMMEWKYSDRLANLGGNAIREIFGLLKQPNMISFAGGFPTRETMPTKEVAKITEQLMSSDQAYDILQYGGTEGYEPLRHTAVNYISRYGIKDIDIDNTLIISGGQQGIDLTYKAFINKGDVVLVENPTYLATLHILKTYEGTAVGVDANEEGLNLLDLENKIKQYNPKVLYVVPTFSNPTGRTYSVENRKAIAELTAKHGVVVLEDDPYSELRYEGDRVPSIKSFDKTGNIIFISSFSKVFAPGLRTGIMVSSKEIIRKLTIGKQAVDVHTSALSQAIINEFLISGAIEERIKKLIPLYREKKEFMLTAIQKYMPKEFKYTNPKGGLFIFGGFPEEMGINTAKLFKELAGRGVAYVSGDSFFAGENVFNTLRLNFSNATKEQIDSGIKKMGEFFAEKLAGQGAI